MSEPVRAKKSLGQNFLTDPNLQKKIVAALEPQVHDTVLEIGPGLGALTAHLIGQVERLVAIELDDQLAERLQHEHGARSDFQLIHQNVLDVDFPSLNLPPGFKVIGNIPYNITTPLLFRLLEPDSRPALLIVMVQKEVALRIGASPGNKDYGALTVGVQSVASVERLFNVSRGAFRPVPNVDSAVIKITPFRPAPLTPPEEIDLRSLTRTLFSQRRKQIQNVLRHAPDYAVAASQLEQLEAALGIPLSSRPEELSPAQFVTMSRVLRSTGKPDRFPHEPA